MKPGGGPSVQARRGDGEAAGKPPPRTPRPLKGVPMKNVKTTLRARLLAAVAAFGFTAIGGATAASAHEGHATGAKVQVRHTVPASANASARASVATGYWQRSANGYVWRETRPRIERNHYKVTRVRPGVDRYDIDRDGRLDHFEIDYRRFDTDRDGVLSHGERYPY